LIFGRRFKIHYQLAQREYNDKCLGTEEPYRIRWYGCVLRLNEKRIPVKIVNMKVKAKLPVLKLPRSVWEQQVRKYVTWKEEHRKKLRGTVERCR
jgi:hypothetical protein